MEFRNFVGHFRKYSLFIILISFLGSAIAYSVATSPAIWRVEQLFYLAAKIEKSQPDAQSNFYVLENARNFTDTAIGILAQDKTENRVTVRKVAPQLIRVTLTINDFSKGETQLAEIGQRVNLRIESLSNQSLQLLPLGDPQITNIKFDRRLITIFGFLAGFILATFVTGLKTYFRL